MSDATSPRPDTTTGPAPPAEPVEPVEPVDSVEPVEIEVKFGVGRPELLRALIEDPDPARLAGFEPAGATHVVVVTDRYLDTGFADGRLYLAGLRARLRETDSGVTLTVKRRGVLTGAITTRTELEGPATPALDPDAWPPSDARAVLLASSSGDRLVEIAALQQRRLTRILVRDATLVEMSLDEMDALEGDRSVDHRVELEAELKAGPAGPLHELAEALVAIEGIGPPAGSKLDFALRGRRPPFAPPTGR